MFGSLAGAWLIQAHRFAVRSSTRQTTHLNLDKKVNSKPSETGRSPLNRLANRPVILRTAAYFEFLRLFFLSSVFGCVLFRAVFSCAVLFYCRKNHFSVLFEYGFTPWKRQKNHAKPISTHSRFLIGVRYNRGFKSRLLFACDLNPHFLA